MDESEHPFTEGVPGDIRVTTRFDTIDPFSGLLGAVHEQLGGPRTNSWDAAEVAHQPVGLLLRVGVEESQSLLFEINLCRSRSFVAYLKPLLEKDPQVSGDQ